MFVEFHHRNPSVFVRDNKSLRRSVSSQQHNKVVVVDAELVALMLDVFHQQEELLQPIVCHSQTKVSGVSYAHLRYWYQCIDCNIHKLQYGNIYTGRQPVVKRVVLQCPPRKRSFTVAKRSYPTALLGVLYQGWYSIFCSQLLEPPTTHYGFSFQFRLVQSGASAVFTL